jgi:hypothetical protein
MSDVLLLVESRAFILRTWFTDKDFRPFHREESVGIHLHWCISGFL